MMPDSDPTLINSSENDTQWAGTLAVYVCEFCDWVFYHVKVQQHQRCPYCFHSELSLLDSDEISHITNYVPELYFPFSVGMDVINSKLRDFAKGIRFAPKDLSFDSLNNRLTKLYFPNWLVDVHVSAGWEAEMGYNYDVVSHQEHFDQNSGLWRTHEFTETRIKWEHSVGRLNRSYQNIRAPGIEEAPLLLQKIGQFDISTAHPFHKVTPTSTFFGIPKRSREDAWPEAEIAINSTASLECMQAAQADHIRQFRWQPDYDSQNWTLLLSPIYSTYYLDDDDNPQVILIHGQTGSLSGKQKASMRKARQVSIAILLIAITVFLLSLVIAFASMIVPPMLIPGGIGIFISILLAISAMIPVGMVWHFNRKIIVNT